MIRTEDNILANYKVLKPFKDLDTDITHKPTEEGNIIELSIERGDYIVNKLGPAYLVAMEDDVKEEKKTKPKKKVRKEIEYMDDVEEELND